MCSIQFLGSGTNCDTSLISNNFFNCLKTLHTTLYIFSRRFESHRDVRKNAVAFETSCFKTWKKSCSWYWTIAVIETCKLATFGMLNSSGIRFLCLLLRAIYITVAPTVYYLLVIITSICLQRCLLLVFLSCHQRGGHPHNVYPDLRVNIWRTLKTSWQKQNNNKLILRIRSCWLQRLNVMWYMFTYSANIDVYKNVTRTCLLCCTRSS